MSSSTVIRLRIKYYGNKLNTFVLIDKIKDMYKISPMKILNVRYRDIDPFDHFYDTKYKTIYPPRDYTVFNPEDLLRVPQMQYYFIDYIPEQSDEIVEFDLFKTANLPEDKLFENVEITIDERLCVIMRHVLNDDLLLHSDYSTTLYSKQYFNSTNNYVDHFPFYDKTCQDIRRDMYYEFVNEL